VCGVNGLSLSAVTADGMWGTLTLFNTVMILVRANCHGHVARSVRMACAVWSVLRACAVCAAGIVPILLA
jgi:hypothetical protein